MSIHFTKIQHNSTNVRIIKTKQSLFQILFGAGWHLAPAFTERLIKTHFFAPVKRKITQPERAYLKNARRFEVQVHDKTVRCWQWGHGPAILFVHGWNGRGINLHHFFKPFLNAGYAVITFDAPGHGQSQGQTTSYFEFTDTVRALLTTRLDSPIQGIIAHSMGGSAVINALSKIDLALDVVLIAPALRLQEILFNTFNRYGIPRRIYQKIIAEFEAQYGYSLHQDNPYRLIKDIDTPVLPIHDRNDRTVPYIDSKKTAEKWPQVLLYTTKELGHKRILGDRAVIDFAFNHITHRCAKVSNL